MCPWRNNKARLKQHQSIHIVTAGQQMITQKPVFFSKRQTDKRLTKMRIQQWKKISEGQLLGCTLSEARILLIGMTRPRKINILLVIVVIKFCVFFKVCFFVDA